MASALFQQLIDRRPDAAAWRVESAGVWAMDGSQASTGAQAIMQARGIDLHGHTARSVTYDLLRQFDLILTMERNHKEALSVEFRDLSPRIFLLSEMTGQVYDIPDPIGGEQADYEATARELEHILAAGMERIAPLAHAS